MAYVGVDVMVTDLDEYTCPECGTGMLADNPDEYCLECIHEGRV